jgi:redox-sensitive bicupin YhaK (pirin superfamily)
MRVIHFTEGATDPLEGFDAKGVHFVPLADGSNNTHISCAHLDAGAKIDAPSLTHAAALLVVHGRVTIVTDDPESRIDIHAGMGSVFGKDERYTVHSEAGAILLIIECEELIPHRRGISTPGRIAGQTWPSDPVLS